MALNRALTPNSIIKPSPLTCLSTFTQRKPATTTLRFKSNPPLLKNSISNKLTPKTPTPICNYGDSSNTTYNEQVSTKSMANPIPESRSHRIWWSNVEVKWPKNVFVGGRKWNSLDIQNLGAMVLMHGLALFAPFAFNWAAFWVAVVLYFVTGLFGITLTYHRILTHKSFKLPKWLEYFFAYCGVLALQRDPIFWVSSHRYHHQFVDSKQDPHSPLKGFWYSQVDWVYDTKAITEKCGELSNVQDLEKQPFYRFLRSTYLLHPLLLGILLYALGGFPYVVWGLGVRAIWLYHITGLVNSASHVWGKQAWNTGDLSKNNWWVALLSFGEGWHNNHHAFEYSARHGLEWWQIDMTWYIVKLLQIAGLATDVKLPTKDHKQRLAFHTE